MKQYIKYINQSRLLILCCTILISLTMYSCSDGQVSSGKSEDIAETSNNQKKTALSNLVTVYKSPTCGCCTKWEEHLQLQGFKVVSHKKEDMIAIKKKYGITRELASCHTAIVNGYVIEGHVPASDIKRLLKERPARIAGLTAPGMPGESPGMQPHDKKPNNYNVLSFTKSGQTKVYSHY